MSEEDKKREALKREAEIKLQQEKQKIELNEHLRKIKEEKNKLGDSVIKGMGAGTRPKR